MFRSLYYVQNLLSANLLAQAVQKLPPKLREAWAVHTITNKWSRSTLLEFNDWIKEKAETHERIKFISAKPKVDEILYAATKRKSASKVFASALKAFLPTAGHGVLPGKTLGCIDCKEAHPLWRCPLFHGNTPMQRPKVAADNKLCFSYLNGQHFFRQCPKQRKCTSEGSSKPSQRLVSRNRECFLT